MAKTLNTRIQQKYDTHSNWLAVEQDTSKTTIPLDGEIIVYGVDSEHAVPQIKIGDGVTPLQALDFVADYTFTPEIIKVTKPTIQSNFIYNSTEQSVVLNDFDETIMTVLSESVRSATDAGTYHIYVCLNDTSLYHWDDDTDNILDLEWTIDKKDQELEVFFGENPLKNGDIIELTTLESIQLDVSYEGQDYYVSADVATEILSISKDTDTVTLRGHDHCTANVTIGVSESDNYKAALLTITINVTVEVSNILNNNSWETINEVTKNGRAADTWSVGDYKFITIPKGTKIGSYFEAKNDIECAAVILGFDHDGEGTKTIDFGFPYKVTINENTQEYELYPYAITDRTAPEAIYSMQNEDDDSSYFRVGNNNTKISVHEADAPDGSVLYSHDIPCFDPMFDISYINLCFSDIMDQIFPNQLTNVLLDMRVYSPNIHIYPVNRQTEDNNYYAMRSTNSFYGKKLKVPSTIELGHSITLNMLNLNNNVTETHPNNYTNYILPNDLIDVTNKTYTYYANGNSKYMRRIDESGYINNQYANYWFRDSVLIEDKNNDVFADTLCVRNPAFGDGEPGSIICCAPNTSHGVHVIFRIGGNS